jgi:poly(3-hydroxybutyrate) depolymerase
MKPIVIWPSKPGEKRRRMRKMRHRLLISAALLSILLSLPLGSFADPILPNLHNAEWLLLGPFSCSQTDNSIGAEYDRDYLTELGGESKAQPRFSQKTAGKQWRKARAVNGQIDLGSVYGEQSYCSIYAYLEFRSDKSDTAVLKLGSDDGLKVWFNGQLLLTNNVRRPLNPEDDMVRIRIKSGTNRLLLKIVQLNGPWGFAAQLGSLPEAVLQFQKADFKGYRICMNQYQPVQSPLNLSVSTIPASAVKEKAELAFLNRQGKLLQKMNVWTGEPVIMNLPWNFKGIGTIIVSGTGPRTGVKAEAVVLVGDPQRIIDETIELARSVVSKTPYRDKGEDPAATLTFLADQLEGKTHPSLSNPERNLRAIRIIDELTQAASKGPWVIGSKRGIRQWAYRSAIDGSCQPYTVYLPEGYTDKRKYSLLVNLHGYSATDYNGVDDLVKHYRPDDFVIVAPFGRADLAYASVGEQDVLDVIDLMQRTYSIDPDRIYLMGSSMGGCGAWRIGQFYADRFAAAAPFCGWTNTKYFSNLSNLPVFIVHGSDDLSVPVSRSQAAAAGLKELGYQARFDELPGVGHNALESWLVKNGGSQFFQYLRRFRRNLWPDKVTVTIPYLRHGRHYWVRVEDKAIWHQPCQLTAKVVDERHLSVETVNVTAFSLNLNHPKLARDGRIIVNIDGYSLAVNAGIEDTLFTLSENQSRFVKTGRPSTKLAPHEGGGLADIFTGPLYIVYGTKGRSKILKQAAEILANWTVSETYSSGTKVGRFRVIADRDVTEEVLKSSNLLCIGTTAENTLTARLSKKMPVWFSKDKVEVLGKEYPKSGFTLVYCNPEAPTHLVGIISLPFKDKDLISFMLWLNFSLRSYALDNGVGSFTTPDLIVFDRPDHVLWHGSFDLFWKELREM